MKEPWDIIVFWTWVMAGPFVAWNFDSVVVQYGILIIYAAGAAAWGSFMGRRDLLKDLGMTMADYVKRLDGRRPT